MSIEMRYRRESTTSAHTLFWPRQQASTLSDAKRSALPHQCASALIYCRASFRWAFIITTTPAGASRVPYIIIQLALYALDMTKARFQKSIFPRIEYSFFALSSRALFSRPSPTLISMLISSPLYARTLPTRGLTEIFADGFSSNTPHFTHAFISRSSDDMSSVGGFIYVDEHEHAH